MPPVGDTTSGKEPQVSTGAPHHHTKEPEVSTETIIVQTPRGLARVVWDGWQYGLHIVNVKFLDTGSPWTFEATQVKAVQA